MSVDAVPDDEQARAGQSLAEGLRADRPDPPRLLMADPAVSLRVGPSNPESSDRSVAAFDMLRPALPLPMTGALCARAGPLHLSRVRAGGCGGGGLRGDHGRRAGRGTHAPERPSDQQRDARGGLDSSSIRLAGSLHGAAEHSMESYRRPRTTLRTARQRRWSMETLPPTVDRAVPPSPPNRVVAETARPRYRAASGERGVDLRAGGALVEWNPPAPRLRHALHPSAALVPPGPPFRSRDLI